MIGTALLGTALLFLSQESRPVGKSQSRPASRAAKKSIRQGRRPADFANGAPGRAVMREKFLPILHAPYCDAEKATRRVRDKDIVIGIKKGDKAFCYPINMLGGPQREIINEEIGGQPFAVNW